MLQRLTRYIGIGVLNTIIHWTIFLALHMLFGRSQAISNFVAFGVAVTFSFFFNARYTFQARATSQRYLVFVAFMGGVSLAVGKLADYVDLPSLATLVAFSAISLGLGFVYSQWIVFRS
ncbi:GtrA family protein [Halomonas sp. McH1-25]|uniref:GtrA family protein n=1 Tax=unclassified Halomonas TaxID=2609666 RepID=UPI001EF61D3E|nr:MULTISPECIES: GtrA family protein [unclassified Halomonas]MCG7600448.1 GtrA family protein [Halomonas sp. McH1-25]MCP1344658.1 GtrA family protein [Halomonas sp. FL8]MCP1363177.1 GtrA family protein [Halomonas sp. BBD45]MCP1365759.1 GtrA family protein [Halomonas sp. BBD48]